MDDEQTKRLTDALRQRLQHTLADLDPLIPAGWTPKLEVSAIAAPGYSDDELTVCGHVSVKLTRGR